MAERKVLLCVTLFDFFHRWILIHLTWNLSRFVPIQSRFLRGISGKNYFGRIFINFVQTKAILYQNLCNSGILSAILFWNCIALKKFTQVLSYVVCTQVKIKKSQKEVRGRKARTFVFRKHFLFTLSLWLTTPYSLCILVWNFYHTFVIVSIEFWMRFESHIRSTRFTINFLFITARAERKVRLCVKLFDFFIGEHSSVWP